MIQHQAQAVAAPPASDGPPPGRRAVSVLAPARLERVEGWGMAHAADCRVLRPVNDEQVAAAFAEAQRWSWPVTLRGGGQSYGDAAIRQEAVLLDLTRMQRILSWEPETGIIEVEPGTRIGDIWRHVVEDGWWPPVVSGTMFPTAGGAAAMNIHGKNNYRVGTFGEHLLSFDLLAPGGTHLHCSRDERAEIFHAAIGGLGMLGAITRVRLKMKRIYSGDVRVRAVTVRNLGEMLDCFEKHTDQDYLVGWVDGTARGRRLGRGLMHLARHLAPDEDPHAAATLKVCHQELPDTFFGFVPKASLWAGVWLFLHPPGMRVINAVKYHAGRREAAAGEYRQSHAAFNFLLDYVPNWKWAYRPGGLVQFQAFVPRQRARTAFEALLGQGHAAGIPCYLGVVKKHRPDPFLISHGLDGYSLAMDFPVLTATRARLQAMARHLAGIVLAAGGRFYFAKDGVLLPEEAQQAIGQDSLARLRELKTRLDPRGVLESDLSRRLALFS
ncbi:MAG: FAD-binding oxidoreductase [Candidatus Schekmanbacteria bacterium]|nr:FAD-binding oxidoreductase [Candidatus Schekmanbacteria bacterium]